MFGGRFSSSFGYIGIDLGARGVRMLQLRGTAGRLRVIGAARIDAAATIEPGTPWSPTADQLSNAVRTAGFSGRWCAVTLPRRSLHLQAVRLPRMPEKELRQAAEWEAAARFELERNAMEVDYLPTGASAQGSEGREEVLLVASAREEIDRCLAPVLAAGLRPLALDADFAALSRFLGRHYRRETDQEHTRAVVEVGASGSSVMILRGNQIAFHKHLSLSGDDLTRAVMEHLSVDAQAAAELRQARIAAVLGRDGTDAPLDASTDRAVYEAVRPLLIDLSNEVVLCLRYYGVTFRGRPPETLILSGGDGLEPRLDTLLGEACKVPAHYDDPRGLLDDLASQVRSTMNRNPGPPSSWTIAAGLSLRGMSERASREGEPASRSAA